KLQVGRSSFSRTSAVEILGNLLSEEEASKWDQLLKTCEMARFAPGALPDVNTSISEAKTLADIGDERIYPSNRMSLIVLFILSFTSATMTASSSLENKILDENFNLANAAYVEGN
ncbi:MAG: hypothetical protein QMC37_03550, partial [Flavobacteriales bacterium]